MTFLSVLNQTENCLLILICWQFLQRTWNSRYTSHNNKTRCTKWPFSKKFLLRFFGMATKYFDLGMNIMNIMMIITTFLVHFVPKMSQNVRGSRNRCICRRAVAIVSKWSQEAITFVAHKNLQYAYTYGTQNLINVNFFISDIQKIADVI